MGSDPDRPTGGVPAPAASRRGSAPFFKDLYWVIAITIAAGGVALLTIPPRQAETLELLRTERRSVGELRELEKRERELETAIEAIHNDPFYLRGVLRNRLGLKRDSEEFLEPPPPPFPITPVAAH